MQIRLLLVYGRLRKIQNNDNDKIKRNHSSKEITRNQDNKSDALKWTSLTESKKDGSPNEQSPTSLKYH